MLITLINGMPGENVSMRDRGFQYGDGLFETLAVVNGSPLLWDRHMQRLLRGAARLGIDAPSEILLRQEAEQVCRSAGCGVLKIILTRGISGRGYAPDKQAQPTRTVSLSPWRDYPVEQRTHGVAAQFCRTMISRNQATAGIKHLNRIEQVLARAELEQECREGLMCNEFGHVIAGTMTNLFIVSQDRLLTPDLSHSGVEGVMRGLVLERAVERSLDARVMNISKSDVLQADEVFLTNSLIGLWPVRRIETKEYPLGGMTQRIQEAIVDAYAGD
ncbi:aminodeoxychorismate lyase [Sulfuricaulis sp.]|uniref:aminodeoxychorismate lyase n=1 Tax=Sulfuricaulis sp. TaxID=2003553 RepID=UPI0035597494